MLIGSQVSGRPFLDRPHPKVVGFATWTYLFEGGNSTPSLYYGWKATTRPGLMQTHLRRAWLSRSSVLSWTELRYMEECYICLVLVCMSGTPRWLHNWSGVKGGWEKGLRLVLSSAGFYLWYTSQVGERGKKLWASQHGEGAMLPALPPVPMITNHTIILKSLCLVGLVGSLNPQPRCVAGLSLSEFLLALRSPFSAQRCPSHKKLKQNTILQSIRHPSSMLTLPYSLSCSMTKITSKSKQTKCSFVLLFFGLTKFKSTICPEHPRKRSSQS